MEKINTIVFLGTPSGTEWMLLLVVLVILLLFPITAVYYYSKSKRLSKELESMKAEKEILLKKILDQK